MQSSKRAVTTGINRFAAVCAHAAFAGARNDQVPFELGQPTSIDRGLEKLGAI